MESLFDGIEIFFDAIRKKCYGEEEYAAEILKARGFLLKETGLVLSDNSHKDDAAYLNELLTEENLGEVKDRKIFVATGANVEKIFYSNNVSRCEGSVLCYSEDWKKFIRNSYAPKVPLKFLEPFVGRYVKAINACGVATCMSCDGNHHAQGNSQRILINFEGEPNILWHKIIRQRLLVKNFGLRWLCCDDSVKIPFKKTDKWKTYAEFNRAGEFLYDNRIKIRQIRREASDGITLSMTRHLSSGELAKIFSERANKLFDDFSEVF